jgi:hypothetical protein
VALVCAAIIKGKARIVVTAKASFIFPPHSFDGNSGRVAAEIKRRIHAGQE